MAGVNKAILIGNLGRDPELTTTQSGKKICKFSLATSKNLKDGSSKTEWHRCTAFDKRGEAIHKNVKKGEQLYIEGEIQYGQYDKDGIKYYTTDIIVSQFSFIGSKRK
ncbi:MAG: single-stranded DNA-binding protein [Desulfobacterales bacterium]|nr:single-stranded DNA-binding protein [Desulfobacterales bacterium]